MVVYVTRFHNLSSQLLRNPSLSSWQRCNYSSQRAKAVPLKNSFVQPALSKPLDNIGKPVYAGHKAGQESTQVTTLSNGLRVASENRFGQFCTIGVIIDSGCRYEVAYPSGISHFLEKLAFNSTADFKSKDDIMLALEKHGGICDSLASRDTFVYAASADRRGLEGVVHALSEIILRPRITPDEIEAAKQQIKFELESLMMRPDQEPILLDMIHAAAYRDNTLGLPKLCPQANLEVIDRTTIFKYLKNHYTPDRMVLAGVGINHDELVKTVEKYFVSMGTSWDSSKAGKTDMVDYSVAQYTGGIVQEECQIPQHVGPSGLPELAHVMIGLEGCSHQDPDFIAMCVLGVMMGGGGSFSAGGPGKGMYTRLYTNVLNRYHWMYSATAFNQSYADTGLFYIHASAPPRNVRDIIDVMTKEMANMAGEVEANELRRAKTQLQSMILMNLEARPVMFEDIARQVLATGQRKQPSEFIRKIEAIKSEDIERVASRLMRSQPSVAARGDIRKLPSLTQIHTSLLDNDARVQGKGTGAQKMGKNL